MITYCATGVGSTMEKCASHSDNLCLHLSYTRKDVWVKWVAPCKVSVYLQTNKQTKTPKNETQDGKICANSHFYCELWVGGMKGSCLSKNIQKRNNSVLLNEAKSNMFSSSALTICGWEAKVQRCIQGRIPSPGVWSTFHLPSTLHQKHILSPTSPHLQQQIIS